jgi:hypothetical protein
LALKQITQMGYAQMELRAQAAKRQLFLIVHMNVLDDAP